MRSIVLVGGLWGMAWWLGNYLNARLTAAAWCLLPKAQSACIATESSTGQPTQHHLTGITACKTSPTPIPLDHTFPKIDPSLIIRAS